MGRTPLGWLPRLCQSFSSSLSCSLRPILGARADERLALFHVSRFLYMVAYILSLQSYCYCF